MENIFITIIIVLMFSLVLNCILLAIIYVQYIDREIDKIDKKI